MRSIRLLAILLSFGVLLSFISCDIRDIQIESGETEGKEVHDNTVPSVELKTLADIRAVDPDAFFYLFYAFFEHDGKWKVATVDEKMNIKEIRSIDKRSVGVDDLLNIEVSNDTGIFDIVEAVGIPTTSYTSGMISLVFKTSDGARATVYFANNEQVGLYVTDVVIDPYSIDFVGMKYSEVKRIMGSKGKDIGFGTVIYEWQMPDGKVLHVWFDTSNWILDEYTVTDFRFEDPIIPETEEPTEVFYDEYTESPDFTVPTESDTEKIVDRIVLRYHGNPYNAITIYDAEECNLLYGYVSRAGGTRGESTRGYYGIPFTLDIYLIGGSERITFCLWSEDSYSTSMNKDENGYQYFYNDDLSEMYDYLEEKYPDEIWYGPDCIEPTAAPDTDIATEVPMDEPVGTGEPV